MKAPSTSPTLESPTVLAIDDDSEVRKSLEQLFATVGLQVRTFESAEPFLAAKPYEGPGCILLDLQMPGMSGIELLRQLVENERHLPILMVTAHAEVRTAVEALKLGAFDFVEKPYSAQRMLEKVRVAIEHDSKRRQAMAERAETRQQIASLSPRELEVVERLIHGRSPKEIADELAITAPTVNFHRKNALRKMNVESVVDLVRAIAKCGGI